MRRRSFLQMPAVRNTDAVVGRGALLGPSAAEREGKAPLTGNQLVLS